MNTEIDASLGQRLRPIAARATDSQRQFMESLVEREREPKNLETLIDELEKLGESRLAAIRFFKDLAEAGCGQFKAGRRGKQTRLVWKNKAKNVARAFLNSQSIELQVSEAANGPQIAHDNAMSPQWHSHVFLLRPGVQVSLDLPLDLTAEESTRLAEFVRALPFRQSTPSEAAS